jgi:dephospho-CoA kinase
MSVIIGLTGGIGSGKSTIAKVFENMGIPVFNADNTAKDLMNSNPILKEKLVAAFGAEVYKDNDQAHVDEDEHSKQILNRAYLSKLVFTDPAKLTLLNSIVHPITIQAALNWASLQSTPYVIKEAALFFESAATVGVHKIIGVSAPKAVRINRVMKRDHCTKEEVENRMKHQIEESLKMKLCDWVIVNDDLQLVLPQVVALHETILTSL